MYLLQLKHNFQSDIRRDKVKIKTYQIGRIQIEGLWNNELIQDIEQCSSSSVHKIMSISSEQNWTISQKKENVQS